MKLLLDMYKSAPKEQRDKVQLMAAEKKTKAEVEELRGRIRELEEKEKKESKKMADEDALRKIKMAEEQIEHLQKKLAATKQEDISRLRRKLEKQRKVEVYADADEILQEEIKEYKAKLTCPCCNTRKKDAVLTKCFHVFCFDCVKTRYDTRQRKCPKCN
ncbi:E3 ubiquitin-protein ligase BRE1B-like, partial [Protobothrops mucrosquamatus]|uniref:E3 ubiquitin-protein ligase BRE1B-like n=1 Tax=Protobothrops mucrosquamatus TaxID=103944 RepID=UPI000775CA6B